MGFSADSRVDLLAGLVIGAAPAPGAKPDNPFLFQRFVVPPSSVTRFLLSDRGLSIAAQEDDPQRGRDLEAMGEPVPGNRSTRASIPPEPMFSEPEVIFGRKLKRFCQPRYPHGTADTSGCGCGRQWHRLQLEPALNARLQDEESVDFIYDGVGVGADLIVAGATDFRDSFSGLSAYYVHRAATGCAPTFEGVLPNLVGLNGEAVSADGNPVVAADPVRAAFFIADQPSGIDCVFGHHGDRTLSTTRANLLSAVTCPAGTHNAAQAASCWPQRVLVNPLPNPMASYEQENPSMAVDQRASGVGAGDIYLTATEFDFNSRVSRSWLVACKNNLGVCSAPTFITGFDLSTTFTNVQVRPDGGSLSPILHKPTSVTRSTSSSFPASPPERRSPRDARRRFWYFTKLSRWPALWPGNLKDPLQPQAR